MRRLVIGAALLIAAATVGVAALPAQAAGSLTATFSKDSDWGSGYQGKYTIANGTATAITSWKVEFDLPAGTSVGTFWDALVSQSGGHVVATNREYNGNVAAGGSASFGFVVSGSGVPSNCKLNGASCAGGGGGGDTTPPSTPGNLHVVGTPTSSTVSLAWNASTDNVGVTGYDVISGGSVVASATGTSTTVGGLNPSTTYTFTVKARDAAGNASAASTAVSATTGSGGGGGGNPLPVAPYVDMGSWPTPVLTDMATAGNLKGFTLAFVNSAGCKASWFNAYDPRSKWQSAEIQKIS